MKVPVRIYGTVFGVSPEAYSKFVEFLPFDQVSYKSGLLEIEHEGNPVNVDSAVEKLLESINDQAEGKIDFIDNDAWVMFRYNIRGKSLDVRKYNLNDVLEGKKEER